MSAQPLLDAGLLAHGRAAPSDADLLVAVAGGSEPAFEELRRRYLRAIEHACRRLMGADAEDCAQEVLVRVWRKARLFDRSRGSAAAWLLTLARRTAINLRARRVPEPADATDEAVEAFDAAEVDRYWLARALEQLPSQERLVLELAYRGDLSQSRIAADLDVPLGSVKSWTRRGLNRLATLLEEER